MVMVKQEKQRLQAVLAKAAGGGLPDERDIRFLLSVTDDEGLAMLFAAAREVRRQHFGAGVFLYGFIYFSTFCRNDCRFCHYRRSNTALPRYRKTPEEIIETAEVLAGGGVHLIDLTMGEWPDPSDPSGRLERTTPADRGVKTSGKAHPIVDLVETVKARSGLPVMASPGVVSDATLRALAAAGADWYACYQETHNPGLFAELRVGQSFAARMDRKRTAKGLGMLVEEGIMIGIGETAGDVAGSIAAMRMLDADQVRVMTFVPQDGTPMADYKTSDALREAVVIAVLRLAFPDRLIPASLDVGGLAGLAERLDAGANVVTSIVVPGKGLAGVANQTLDIEQARRTPVAIAPVLDRCGLRVADPDDYRRWIARRQFRRAPAAAVSISV